MSTAFIFDVCEKLKTFLNFDVVHAVDPLKQNIRNVKVLYKVAQTHHLRQYKLI